MYNNNKDKGLKIGYDILRLNKINVNSKVYSTTIHAKFNFSFSSYNVSSSVPVESTTLSLWLIIKCRFSALGEPNEPLQIGH